MNPNKKFLDFALGGVGIISWMVFRQLLTFFWELLRLPIYESLPVGVPDLLAFVAALAGFLVLRRNAKVSEFGLEVIAELSKVTWPTRKETMISTGVIIVMVGIASLMMFVIDTVWGTLTRSFLEF